MDIRNNYKRFQSYQSNNVTNNIKKNYIEQQQELGPTKELGQNKGLSNPDTSFLQRSVKIGIKNGEFVKK